jgi:hypothetical protein
MIRATYQIGQVNSFGEKGPPESDFPPSARGARQQGCPENPRKPATQRGARSGGEHVSYGNWRRECTRIRTFADLLT